MNILFVNHQDFRSSSAVHIFNLANALTELGVSVRVAVPSRPETVHMLGRPRFAALSFAASRADAGGVRPDLIWAWTPREVVRRHTQRLAAQHGCAYGVHLEDNEEAVLTGHTGQPLAALCALPRARLDRLVGTHFTHPLLVRAFLSGAAGVSLILDRLAEFVPASVPTTVFWPGYEAALFQPRAPDPETRRRFGLAATDFVVAYTGGTHQANAAEIETLYQAIALLRRRGRPVRLLRTGIQPGRRWVRRLQRARDGCVELGYVDRAALPAILAQADVLVQPGAPGPFNDYRFPSKLPEFFAMGKPVILPRTNIGLCLRADEDALLLHEGSPTEIAAAIERLYQDRALAARLAENGRRFAETHFSWARAARALLSFWSGILPDMGRRPIVLPPAPTRQNTCVVIVTHHPDAAFPERCEPMRRQADRTIIVDNHSPPAALAMLRQLAQERPNIELIANADNRGVATALNQGVEAASAQGCDWLLFFDQDSVCDPDLLDKLAALRAAHPAPHTVAVMGPNYTNARTGQPVYRFPAGAPPFVEVAMCITSAALTSRRALQLAGPFRDDLFVDGVDTEMCFRLRAAGFRILMSTAPLLTHTIGRQTACRRFGREWITADHIPPRRYYMARNRIILARAHLFHEPRQVWRDLKALLKEAGLCVLCEDGKRAKLQAYARGIRDGLAGQTERMEPTQETHP